ncbi:unnamed protein product [Victoria cruziana]
MAVKHFVLIKFKEGTSAEEIIKKMEEMTMEIDKVKSFEWGQDMESEEMLRQGFTHAFSLTFESKEEFVAFSQHPTHLAFAELLLSAVEKAIVFDFPVVQVKPPVNA